MFTVIIPVYNARPYLHECLDSVLAAADGSDVEILCVDDGSTDGSGEILAGYEKRFPNFRVFAQENKGNAAARNLALPHVRGEYLCFVDADDTVEPSYFIRLEEEARKTNADLVFLNFRGSNGAGSWLNEFRHKVPSVDGKKRMLVRLSPSTWSRIYRTEFFRGHSFTFPEHCLTGPDRVLHWKGVLRTERVGYVGEPLYYYRNTPGSVVHTYDKKWPSIFHVATEIRLFLTENELYENYRKTWYFDLALLFSWADGQIRCPDEKKKFRARVSSFLDADWWRWFAIATLPDGPANYFREIRKADEQA